MINDQAAKKGSCARHNDMVVKAHQSVANMQQEVENLKMKLRLEKIASVCFQKSTESSQNEVIVHSPWIYRGKEVEDPTSSNIIGVEYFCECCTKLGLDVVESRLWFCSIPKAKPLVLLV